MYHLYIKFLLYIILYKFFLAFKEIKKENFFFSIMKKKKKNNIYIYINIIIIYCDILI